MKDKIFGVLQRIGRSFMLPIAILPVAGLFLGIGGSFTNETMLETYGLLNIMGPGTILYSILTVISAAGDIVFANLPLLFAMGVAIGMARKEKDAAALSAAIAFLIMHASLGAMIDINGGPESMLSGSTANVLGITSLQMGVFGGIIVGLGVAALHNKFYKIELPQVLSFFGGTRFVPIISSVVFLAVGILMFFVWPPIQTIIYKVGDLVLRSGYLGTGIYGLMERALIPFGLHHVFYLPFWQTAVGGTAVVDGQLIEGAQNIFFAELSSKGIEHFSVSATRFMSGKFPLMIFGLPGAAFAMYKCAKPEKRKIVGGLLLSAALTSMITGITEPLEFTFLFVAPVLYIIHCVFAGLAYMLMHIFGVGVGMTFSGGLIDLTLFGILQGNGKTSWIWIIAVGVFYFIVYYLLFSLLIKKFDYKTPGREAGDGDIKLYTRADVDSKRNGAASSEKASDNVSMMITKGLGGKININDIDCCATRLRITVRDGNKVSEAILKASGAAGVIKKGNGVQIIYGPRVTVIKANLEEFLDSSESNNADEMENINFELNENKNINNSGVLAEGMIFAPIKGRLVELKEVDDGVFSEGMMGKGAAVIPDEGKVFAPFDGECTMVFDTKHAIGLKSDNDIELLIHIGIETVMLKGKCFDIIIKENQKIKKGDLIGYFDLKEIKENGLKIITPIVVTNTDEYVDITVVKIGNVNIGDEIINVK